MSFSSLFIETVGECNSCMFYFIFSFLEYEKERILLVLSIFVIFYITRRGWMNTVADEYKDVGSVIE